MNLLSLAGSEKLGQLGLHGRAFRPVRRGGLERRVEIGDRSWGVGLARPGQSAAREGLRRTWIEAEGLAVVRDGRVHLAFPIAGNAPVVPGFGESGVERQGRIVVADGSLEVSLLKEGKAPVVVRLLEGRVDREGLRVVADRPIKVALLERNVRPGEHGSGIAPPASEGGEKGHKDRGVNLHPEVE